MNHGVRECKDRIHCVNLDFTLTGHLELLGNFTYFLAFDFGNWNAAVFSSTILEISPISAWLWTYFFQQGRKLVDISGFYGIFQIFYPSQATKLTQRQRMNFSTQAKLEQQV